MRVLLALNIKPELEEDMVDYLLAKEGVEGFTSYHARGHGDHHDMSLSEQVSGTRKRLQFEILTDDSQVESVLEGLAENVGKDIVYWVQSVSGMGKT